MSVKKTNAHPKLPKVIFIAAALLTIPNKAFGLAAGALFLGSEVVKSLIAEAAVYALKDTMVAVKGMLYDPKELSEEDIKTAAAEYIRLDACLTVLVGASKNQGCENSLNNLDKSNIGIQEYSATYTIKKDESFIKDYCKLIRRSRTPSSPLYQAFNSSINALPAEGMPNKIDFIQNNMITLKKLCPQLPTDTIFFTLQKNEAQAPALYTPACFDATNPSNSVCTRHCNT